MQSLGALLHHTCGGAVRLPVPEPYAGPATNQNAVQGEIPCLPWMPCIGPPFALLRVQRHVHEWHVPLVDVRGDT